MTFVAYVQTASEKKRLTPGNSARNFTRSDPFLQFCLKTSQEATLHRKSRMKPYKKRLIPGNPVQKLTRSYPSPKIRDKTSQDYPFIWLVGWLLFFGQAMQRPPAGGNTTEEKKEAGRSFLKRKKKIEQDAFCKGSMRSRLGLKISRT